MYTLQVILGSCGHALYLRALRYTWLLDMSAERLEDMFAALHRCCHCAYGSPKVTLQFSYTCIFRDLENTHMHHYVKCVRKVQRYFLVNL
jgi:hypothetical protein